MLDTLIANGTLVSSVGRVPADLGIAGWSGSLPRNGSP